jgi:hypothetical protein
VKRTLPDSRLRARRAALSALRRARRSAERAGVELSDWEGEFLGSVAARVDTFGRAFGDPEKGASGAALSTLQTVKLREIVAKAKGKSPSGQRRRMRRADPSEEA